MAQSGDLFRTITEGSPDGLWLIDPSGSTRYANAAMGGLLGCDVATMTGRPALEAMQPSDAAVLRVHLARLAAVDPSDPSAGAGHAETAISRASGPITWCLVSWGPLVEDGVLLGWLHRFTPYAGPTELAARTRARERRLNGAPPIGRLAAWEGDLATASVSGTDQLRQILGLAAGARIPAGRRFLDLIHPEDHAAVRAAYDRALTDGGQVDLAVRFLLPDGGLRWLHVLGVSDRTGPGGDSRLLGTVHDVTDSQLAEEQAAHTARRLRLQQQIATIANRATTLSEAVRLAGASLPENAPGWAAVAIFDTTGPEPVLVEVYDTDTPPDPALAAQTRRTAGVATCPLDGVGSRVALPVLVHTDVVAVIELRTDEVPPDDASHAMLGQVGAQLGVVATRERAARELAIARDEAVQASRLKSEFLATMSHEIRTPMNGVVGLTDLLLSTDLDEQQRRLGEGLQAAGLDLLAIINDILDLSKVESGKLELEVTDFDVRTVLERTASVMRGAAYAKRLELVVGCDAEVPALLRGDATRLGQVVANLVSNAVKFTESGEVVVRASVAQATDSHVVLRVEVRDTGIGIQPAAQESIFEAFTQADLSTTRRHGGTGLGLAISRQLVEAMSGTLAVVSRPGVGSTFTFTARLQRPVAPCAAETPTALRGRRALVVVDNASARAALVDQLRAWGMDVATAPDAEQALTVLHQAARLAKPYAVALVDAALPVADGVELARRAAEHPGLRDLAVVLLSADPLWLRENLDTTGGVAHVLGKPVPHAELRDTLLAQLRGRDEAPPPDRRDGAAEDARRRLDVSVLVVEDNAVNQMVATGILENLGARVQLADDGRAAVAALAGEHGFDAVLMDCRMPVLDGFDATRAVRSAEAPGSRVPIIAMTASAIEGERERCIGAGMDDFITKPVDPEHLARVLRRWTVDGPALDPARVRMLDELVKDGVSFFDRTARSFMSRIEEQLAAICDAIEAAEAMRTFTSAHLVKGSALNLGLPRVAAAAARIEARADTGATDGYAPLVEALRHEIDHAVAVLADAVR
ncbi:response regulator [Nocardioides sp. dk4132]|uniref:response regulator n=1 Tax=unclassified Nocardioides TaxID=2615069 RepID=UPI0012963F14|nr:MULTISPECIES: response regulator [unclassified Nocardioides]MQW77918.1 response regulator [Nocardioides sp. dk4132]QGA09156.1 response regulator [Nocardioides sp. dk884]